MFSCSRLCSRGGGGELRRIFRGISKVSTLEGGTKLEKAKQGGCENNFTLTVIIESLNFEHLSIIARGRAKYHDLSVASRSIICRCRRQRQIIDLRATNKSWYFARSRPIIVLLFTYKASLYLSLKLTSFTHIFYYTGRYISVITLADIYRSVS